MSDQANSSVQHANEIWSKEKLLELSEYAEDITVSTINIIFDEKKRLYQATACVRRDTYKSLGATPALALRSVCLVVEEAQSRTFHHGAFRALRISMHAVEAFVLCNDASKKENAA